MRKGGFTGVIVGVTGSVIKDEIESFLSHGADAVLNKPLKLSTFRDVLTGNLFFSRSEVLSE